MGQVSNRLADHRTYCTGFVRGPARSRVNAGCNWLGSHCDLLRVLFLSSTQIAAAYPGGRGVRLDGLWFRDWGYACRCRQRDCGRSRGVLIVRDAIARIETRAAMDRPGPATDGLRRVLPPPSPLSPRS